jgi:hypothetical protein
MSKFFNKHLLLQDSVMKAEGFMIGGKIRFNLNGQDLEGVIHRFYDGKAEVTHDKGMAVIEKNQTLALWDRKSKVWKPYQQKLL